MPCWKCVTPSQPPLTMPPTSRKILGESPESQGVLEPHPLFCELSEISRTGKEEIDDWEWKETARWVKFEEDVEEVSTTDLKMILFSFYNIFCCILFDHFVWPSGGQSVVQAPRLLAVNAQLDGAQEVPEEGDCLPRSGGRQPQGDLRGEYFNILYFLLWHINLSSKSSITNVVIFPEQFQTKFPPAIRPDCLLCQSPISCLLTPASWNSSSGFAREYGEQ